MGETCRICNASKREQLRFTHIGVSTPCEFSGNAAAAAIVTWYLSVNRGDNISFVGDYDTLSELPFGLSFQEIDSWPDKTEEVVNELIKNSILKDHGVLYEDEDDPDNIFVRDLRNCW